MALWQQLSRYSLPVDAICFSRDGRLVPIISLVLITDDVLVYDFFGMNLRMTLLPVEAADPLLSRDIFTMPFEQLAYLEIAPAMLLLH